MIPEALRRAHDLVLATPDAEFAAFSEADLHRLIVHRYLPNAMDAMALDDARQRRVVAAFRELGGLLANLSGVSDPLRLVVEPGLQRAAAADSLKSRTLLALDAVILMARWRWPRPLVYTPDPVLKSRPEKVRSRTPAHTRTGLADR